MLYMILWSHISYIRVTFQELKPASEIEEESVGDNALWECKNCRGVTAYESGELASNKTLILIQTMDSNLAQFGSKMDTMDDSYQQIQSKMNSSYQQLEGSTSKLILHISTLKAKRTLPINSWRKKVLFQSKVGEQNVQNGLFVSADGKQNALFLLTV